MRKKLAILNNLIPPYRIPIYNGLAKAFETSLLLSGKESTRDAWENLEEEIETDVLNIWGVTIPFFEKRNGEKFDPRYLHINPGYLLALIRLQPDIVISTEMGFRSISALIYGVLFNKPVWIWWGGTILTERKRSWIKKIIRKIIFKKVSRWISYGKTTTDYLLQLGVQKSHILQIQNCVDERLYLSQSEKKMNISPSPVLLYTGQFIKRKGVQFFLEAAAQLQSEGLVFSVLLVGSGPERENLSQLISQLALKNVSILTSQKPSEMPSIYKSADYLVFPTLEDVWGLVVNEALWSGLTVISSIYAGCAEEILSPEHLFNPLERDSTINILRRAVLGDLKHSTTDNLRPCADITQLIIDRINNETSRQERSHIESSDLVTH